MASTISAGTTSGTAIAISGDTSGSLQLQTNGTTTAVTIDTSQNVGIGTASPTAKLDLGSGNLNFSSTAQRITGDFSNATVANRVAFQTITVNGATNLELIPNGTSTATFFVAESSSSDPANGSSTFMSCTGSESQFVAHKRGSGSYLPMTFLTGGSERARIDTSGRFLLGASTAPASNAIRQVITGGTSNYLEFASTSTDGAIIGNSAGAMQIFTFTGVLGSEIYTERMRIDSSGNLLFNSGYGSVATAYGCRAWVNFNGTGTPAIRASGNVSSITDVGSGQYTVNYSTAMSDANAAVNATISIAAGDGRVVVWLSTTVSASSVTMTVQNVGTGANPDPDVVCVSVFR